MPYDRYYCAARASEERNLAIASTNPKVREVHLDMMARYEALIRANDQPLQGTTLHAQEAVASL
jgi:hypothetical protein